jgi:hypothetical protein
MGRFGASELVTHNHDDDESDCPLRELPFWRSQSFTNGKNAPVIEVLVVVVQSCNRPLSDRFTLTRMREPTPKT